MIRSLMDLTEQGVVSCSDKSQAVSEGQRGQNKLTLWPALNSMLFSYLNTNSKMIVQIEDWDGAQMMFWLRRSYNTSNKWHRPYEAWECLMADCERGMHSRYAPLLTRVLSHYIFQQLH